MNPPRLGIIRMLPDGIPQWMEAVGGLAETKARVMRLASRLAGGFFIYSEKTGTIVEHFICSDCGSGSGRRRCAGFDALPAYADAPVSELIALLSGSRDFSITVQR